MQRVNSAIDRLNRIDWEHEDPSRYASNLRLLGEAAVRFARWSLKVDGVDDTRSAVFFDLAGCLYPHQDTLPYANPRINNGMARRVIPWFLKWEAVREFSEFEMREPDPFEPVLWCFERGGRPHTHHGFLHIEHSLSFAYGYGQWPSAFSSREPTKIADLNLDQVDRDFAARLGIRA